MPIDRRTKFGGYEYMAEINRAVMAVNEAHSALSRVVQEKTGMGVTVVLVARAVLQFNTIRDALEILREMGQVEAERRKRQKKKNPNGGKSVGDTAEQ